MIQEQQQEETSFDLPKIQPINFSDMNESQSPAGGDETLMESFILPG
jgi:hypothetical protein